MTAETISFPLDPGAAALLTRLHAAGHAAYAVGGCVRDSLLGQTPHDWDLCTSATPEQVLELFGEAHCIPTGLQHGTVTVKHGGELYEITTFRTEGAYSDGRHPDAVCFVPDVREDLARRDFTINAMAYSAEEGLIDHFGGRDDLAAHLVRAVGEPERRFEEDALRILRLYRFAARFGFAIDPATRQAARALCRHLDCVSEERIAEELSRLLAAPAPGAYLEAEVRRSSSRNWMRQSFRKADASSTRWNRAWNTSRSGWLHCCARWAKPVQGRRSGGSSAPTP